MKAYDILFILKSNLGEDTYKTLIGDFQGWVTQDKGKILLSDHIGERDLPITFKKHRKGNYVHIQFEGTPKDIDTMKQKVKVDERFIRYLLVTLDSVKAKEKKNKKVREKSVSPK